MTIVGHVEQQLIESMIANPGVEDFNKSHLVDREVASDEELNANVLKIHFLAYTGAAC